ncbi:MAG: O-antigen ligase family protein [Desulfobacterales bacterium]|nr:O-antigen ligase family protein [Desulfobacterales bacterium]
MKFFSFIILFIIATIPILFAAVQPWVWSFYSLCMMAAFILFLWQQKINSKFLVSSPPVNLMVGLFFFVTLFLCLPLPNAVISLLSPIRYETASTAWNLTSAAHKWQTLSYSALNAFTWWTFLLSLFLFFFVVRYLCTDKKTFTIVLAVMISLGLIEAVYGVIQALVPSIGVLWVDYFNEHMGYARGTFINRNHFAGFIEMTWPLILGYTMAMTDQGHSLKRALASDMLNRQALMALGIVVLLLSLLLSRSRAGITGGLVGLMTFWYMARPNIRRIASHTRLLLGAIVVVLCIYCVTIGVEPIFERFLSIGDGKSRIDIWRDSLSILKDHPWGIGLHNFETVFQVYNRSFFSDKTVTYAHNDYFQLLIETGWVGFFILIGGFIFFTGKSFRLIRRFDAKADPKRFFLAVGAFSGIISLAFHSFFDFNLQIPANSLYFVTLIAILSACTEQLDRSRRIVTKP